jgi:hypothetical protein
MALILFKWFLAMGLAGFPVHEQGTEKSNGKHPFFVTVTEIEHNAVNRSLEISCKIFTDDFEKTLRQNNPGIRIDLIHPPDKKAAENLVKEYVTKHLVIKTGDIPVPLNFIGYEIKEDAVISYYEGLNINAVKSIDITDKLLYDYKKEQFGIIHVTVNGNRKSTRLTNPNDLFHCEF